MGEYAENSSLMLVIVAYILGHIQPFIFVVVVYF